MLVASQAGSDVARMDTNRDGAVSESEFVKGGGTVEEFDRIGRAEGGESEKIAMDAGGADRAEQEATAAAVRE